MSGLIYVVRGGVPSLVGPQPFARFTNHDLEFGGWSKRESIKEWGPLVPPGHGGGAPI